jgi:hypothetical protein
MKATSARERLDIAFGRIDDPKGEGARACLTVYREQAKAAADAADTRAKAGISLGPLDGTRRPTDGPHAGRPQWPGSTSVPNCCGCRAINCSIDWSPFPLVDLTEYPASCR